MCSAVPHDLYSEVFRRWLDRAVDHLEHPYLPLLIGIVSIVARHFAQTEEREPIDFIFDEQPDQMKRVMESWEIFLEVAGDEIKPLLAHPPIFRNDKITLPLQAADLHAWWIRRMCEPALGAGPEGSRPLTWCSSA